MAQTVGLSGLAASIQQRVPTPVRSGDSDAALSELPRATFKKQLSAVRDFLSIAAKPCECRPQDCRIAEAHQKNSRLVT